MSDNSFALFDWQEAEEKLNQLIPLLAQDQTENLQIGPGRPLSDQEQQAIKDLEFGPEAKSPDQLLEIMRDLIYRNRISTSHPQFFSFIPLALSPVSLVGDVINSFYSPYGSSHTLSEGVAVAQKNLLNWLGSQAGYPVKELGGIFVSGGSMANLTASVIARDEKLTDDQFARATAYISDQAHSSVAKGIRIMGIPRANIRIVKTNQAFQIDCQDLEKQILADLQTGHLPFLLVGTCGTTNTGTIDPLHDLADIRDKYGLWLHIDGAYGASCLLSSQRHLADGIERSDSLSWDGHKWLFQSYGCAFLLCRDRQAMNRTFNANPEYLTDVKTDDDKINFWDMGIELTAPARGMRLWYSLQRVGLAEYRRAIDRGFANAQYFERLFRNEDYFEIVSPAQLSIVNVRFNDGKHSEAELNEINHTLSELATKRNQAIYYTTSLNAKRVLRFCPINPLLTEKQIVDVVDQIKQDLRDLKLI